MNGRAHKRAIYDGECARLVDPLTGNIIYNAAEVERDVAANIAAFEETYGVQFHEHTLTKTQKAIKCTGHNSVTPAYVGTGCGKDLYFDEMPSGKQIRRTTEAMLEFATNLACILTKDNAIVYCRNSRSRSQAVLVIFYITFRNRLGGELELLLTYLKWAMQSQRRRALGITGNGDLFPNHNRFRMAVFVNTMS